MTQTSRFENFTTQPVEAQAQQQPSQQTAAIPDPGVPPEPDSTAPAATNPRKKKVTRIIAVVIVLALAVALYFIWHTPASTTPAPIITQQNFNGTSSNGGSNTGNSLTTNGDIHVYVVGAVKYPGVYTLPTGARVYQLLEAAGGALPNANLVALNLAAPLSDGEEVYVLAIGEKPPTICNRC